MMKNEEQYIFAVYSQVKYLFLKMLLNNIKKRNINYNYNYLN